MNSFTYARAATSQTLFGRAAKSMRNISAAAPISLI
jgi:hypothetical protein